MGKIELSPAALEARRAYYREYRRRNPDRCQKWEANRWERLAAKNAQAAAANPESAPPKDPVNMKIPPDAATSSGT